jgi:hypothetical protein
MPSISTHAVCGLPGGLDYLLLALVKHGVISKMAEKRLNTRLNQLIRVPGVLVCTSSGVLSLLHGNGRIHWVWMVATWMLDNANAMYYMDRVTGNYHVAVERAREAKRK